MGGVRELLKIKSECAAGEKKCAANAIQIASAFSGMGDYLAGAVGQCSRTTAITGANAGKSPSSGRDALCASGALDLVHHAADVAAAGLELSRHCSAPAARLFEEG